MPQYWGKVCKDEPTWPGGHWGQALQVKAASKQMHGGYGEHWSALNHGGLGCQRWVEREAGLIATGQENAENITFWYNFACNLSSFHKYSSAKYGQASGREQR